MLTPLVDAEAIRDLLNPEVYLAVFDDQRTGDISQVDQSGPVRRVLKHANALVVSSLTPIYAKIPDGTDSAIPDLLDAVIGMYLRYFTWLRREEYTRVTGRDESKLLAEARLQVSEIRAGLMQIAPNDSPPEPSPRNVGGTVRDSRQRVFLDSTNGHRNSGDF
jgi:hypothetical protein